MKQNPNFSPATMARLLATPEGQQLLTLVRQADPGVMRQAMEAVQAGDTARAGALLAPLAQQKNVAELLQKLQKGG